MDNQRFEELKHAVTYGGLPKIDNETFTKEQADELKDILEARSKASLDHIKDIKKEATKAK